MLQFLERLLDCSHSKRLSEATRSTRATSILRRSCNQRSTCRQSSSSSLSTLPIALRNPSWSSLTTNSATIKALARRTTCQRSTLHIGVCIVTFTAPRARQHDHTSWNVGSNEGATEISDAGPITSAHRLARPSSLRGQATRPGFALVRRLSRPGDDLHRVGRPHNTRNHGGHDPETVAPVDGGGP